MKATLHHLCTFTLALLLALVCSPPAWAHDGGPSSGDLRGFILTPTPEAPAGATGFVAIHTGGEHSGIVVATHRLAVGTYTVNSTSAADASVTALGTFDVVDFHFGGDDFGGGGDGPGGFGIAILLFPEGFDPADIASIQVADAAGVTLLSGDNVLPGGFPGCNDHEHERFLLAPTEDAPAGAHGRAEIKVEDEGDLAGTPVLKIKTEGLDAGTYTVSVTNLTDGTATVLGTFDVVAAAGFEDGDDDDETKATLPFPDGFDVTGVASVLVANADGVVLLQGDGTVRGCGVEGSEHLRAEVKLVATVNAPVGATGKATIKAHNEEGEVKAFLKIKTSGLDVGAYTVSVTSLADGSVTVLGTFDVSGTNQDDDDQGDDDQRGGNHRGRDGRHDGDCDFGDGARLSFPAGFNPLDVGTVQIADANGVVMLTGDFSNVVTTTNTNFIAKVRITPGAAAPHAKGLAAASAKARKHHVTQSFKLNAKGVPKNTKFTLKINGAVAGQAKSNAAGQVVVSKLPRGIGAHRISSVVLENAAGQRVLSAHF